MFGVRKGVSIMKGYGPPLFTVNFLYLFVVSLFSVLMVFLAGCEMYGENLKVEAKGLDGVNVEQIELTVDYQQRNDFGFDCVPTDSRILITAYINNPGNIELDATIGVAGAAVNFMQVSRAIQPLASVVQGDSRIMQVALAPAGRELEHTDFTVAFVPMDSNKNRIGIQSRSITLRYNTPPTTPLGVVVGDDGNFTCVTNQKWDVVSGTGDVAKDGYIFWAWPQGMTMHGGASEREPDCAASFVLNGRAYTPRECSAGATITDGDGRLYDLYRLQVGQGRAVELYAKDMESVRGPSLLSGIDFLEIALDAQGGIFDGTASAERSLYFQPDTHCNLSDLPEPVKEGYAFAGWAVDMTDLPVSFPLVVEDDVALTALWQTPAEVGEARNVQALFNLEDEAILVTWSHPYVQDVRHLRIFLEGAGSQQEAMADLEAYTFRFENIERNSGEYRLSVQLVDSAGQASDGIVTGVSTNTESYDEVDNLQAIVLSDRIDFRWTSPPKEDFSHIELTWKGADGTVSKEPCMIEREARSFSLVLEQDFPASFVFRTAGYDGTLSEGMTMYTIRLEKDGDLDTVDQQLVVPAGLPLEQIAPSQDGLRFLGWYEDGSFKKEYDFSSPVEDSLLLFARWKALSD